MQLTSTGPKHDREWMLIDKNGNFVTQRTKPEMGRIKTAFSENHLHFSTDNQSTLKVELEDYGSDQTMVKLFGKETSAHLLNSTYDQWFSEFLKMDVRLVRSPKLESRFTSGNHGPVAPLLFPDGYPLLLTNESTLEELNQKLEAPVTMGRFRPNIVISGAPANQEDQWKQFKINDIPLLSVKACTRCVVIQLHPESGEKNPEVSKTLKSYRTKDGNIIFGSNLTHQNTGMISVGDTLQNIE